MRVHVFVTEDPEHGNKAVRPFAVIPDNPDAFLPFHPAGQQWRYWATTGIEDPILAQQSELPWLATQRSLAQGRGTIIY